MNGFAKNHDSNATINKLRASVFPLPTRPSVNSKHFKTQQFDVGTLG